MKRFLVAAFLLAALVAVAAGCGEKADTTGKPRLESLDLVLDFFPNADHVGIYSAIADGDFEKAGLKVTPRPPSDPSAPLKLLAAGKADLAISYEPELLLARDAGAENLVSVAALVQVPLTAVMALPDSGVRTAADLAGKPWAWNTGWIYLCAQIVTIPAVALAWQVILPQITPKFQFIKCTVSTADVQNLTGLGKALPYYVVIALVAFTG